MSPTSEAPAGGILVLGAQGLLGRALVGTRTPGLVGLDRTLCDVTAPDAVAAALQRLQPRWVVNCAAFTAVDRCETEPERAFAVNGFAAGVVARACLHAGARLVHLSTDYVFNGHGSRPWREDDAPDPLSVYGRSKRVGENAVRAALGDSALIVRAQWLYGPGGPDFVGAILALATTRDRLKVVSDQRGAPTEAAVLAHLLLGLMAVSASGVVHAACAGACTRAEWATAILASRRPPVTVEPCATAEFPRPAPRPENSVFDLSRLTSILGEVPPAWDAVLADYMARTP